MSEARIRNLAQSQSKIFESSPAERIPRRDNPQSQSKIFTPLPYRHKPLTYARAQYERTSICLGTDKPERQSPSPPRPTSGYSPAGKRTNQISSTKYLIGNEKSTFYKKSVNQNFGVPDQFEPKYNGDSAFERKQKEFNSGFSPKKKGENDEGQYSERENLSAKERKLQDRVSIFDSSDCKVVVKQVEKNVNSKSDIYDPKNRKGEILSSDVFGSRTVHEYKRPLEVRENEDDRKKNHLFSDLFGRNTSPTREKVKDRLVPTENYYNAKSRQNLEYDPRGQTSKHLASQIEIGEGTLKNQRNRPMTPQYSQIENRSFGSQNNIGVSTPVPAKLSELELCNVPGHFNAASIKELCGGLHVVSLTLDVDNFTGACKGSGSLKIRTNNPSDLSQLSQTLKSKSIQIKEKQENLGRKSNYAEVSNVSWHHPYDYKKSSTPLGARESKMKNLESSFFTSQIKYSPKPTESFNNELSAQVQWMNTKNAIKNQY